MFLFESLQQMQKSKHGVSTGAWLLPSMWNSDNLKSYPDFVLSISSSTPAAPDTDTESTAQVTHV